MIRARGAQSFEFCHFPSWGVPRQILSRVDICRVQWISSQNPGVCERVRSICFAMIAKDDESLGDLTSTVIGDACYRTFRDGRVFEQNLLDLCARYVVAGTYDHVVNARMIPEEAVFVGMKGVAGEVQP